MIEVVNKHTYEGDIAEPEVVNIMRPYVLGNYAETLRRDPDRASVLRKYRRYLWEEIKRKGQVFDAVMGLVRRHLAGERLILLCCCAPLECHGHILRRAILWLAHQSTLGRSTDPSTWPGLPSQAS
jgi:hypothetical protein